MNHADSEAIIPRITINILISLRKTGLAFNGLTSEVQTSKSQGETHGISQRKYRVFFCCYINVSKHLYDLYTCEFTV
jgi:hypothetical protein